MKQLIALLAIAYLSCVDIGNGMKTCSDGTSTQTCIKTGTVTTCQ